MRPLERILKNLAVRFAVSPLDTLTDICRRLLPGREVSPQVLRLQEITRQTPLILQIETTNVCNARCGFCAYPKTLREKGIMSMPLFERIVQEYAAMGGGPVSLTPVVGDALLDPHLLKRLRILEACPEFRQVSLTTNAIALERYPDEDVCRLLEAIDRIQVSIGGLDVATYETMYGVNRFPQVQRGLERLLALRESVAARHTSSSLSGRTTGSSRGASGGSLKGSAGGGFSSAISGAIPIIRDSSKATKN